MSTDNSNTTENMVKTLSGFLFGRRDIYSSAETITEDNVIWEVNSALVYHLQNVAEEEYLYWYRRGIQPILNRQKDRNEFINNKILQNTAEEIVTFKNGYFLMEPAFYVSRKAGAKNRVDKLNEYLYRSGKQSADNIVADWFHMVGKAALFVEPGPDDDTPIKAYAVDPRSCFVVYSMRPGNKPLFGVNVVTAEDNMLIDVYTQDSVFKLRGGYPGLKVDVRPNRDTIALELLSVEPNRLAPHIPIIEYRYNSVNEGSFESVIYLLDALNTIRSNQVDGVEQFIQSIAVAVNCQFEEGTTADKIKAAGMIALTSIGENKADFRILSEELNQEQTEELVDSIYTQILRICALPSSSSNMRKLAILAAISSACAGVSPCVTPSSTRNPCPISAIISPSTRTDASKTRCTHAFIADTPCNTSSCDHQAPPWQPLRRKRGTRACHRSSVSARTCLHCHRHCDSR